MKEKIIYAIVIMLFIAGLTIAINIGVERQVVKDCEKWNEWTKQTNLFKVSDEMAKTCIEVGIKLDQGKVMGVEATKLPEKSEVKIREIIKTIEATVFAYNSESEQTDSRPYEMASGKNVYVGAIACPANIKFGTMVMIAGTEYTCEDRMGERYRAGNYFDIWMQSEAAARKWGRRMVEVNILK